jgi:hypothetical protein
MHILSPQFIEIRTMKEIISAGAPRPIGPPNEHAYRDRMYCYLPKIKILAWQSFPRLTHGGPHLEQRAQNKIE